MEQNHQIQGVILNQTGREILSIIADEWKNKYDEYYREDQELTERTETERQTDI